MWSRPPHSYPSSGMRCSGGKPIPHPNRSVSGRWKRSASRRGARATARTSSSRPSRRRHSSRPGLLPRAISFTKGCYTGQEVIVRIAHRGHVNRHLRGLLLGDAPAPSFRTPLLHPDTGKEIGWTTSAAFSPQLGQTIALGYLRREVGPGDAVRLGAADGPSATVAPASVPLAERAMKERNASALKEWAAVEQALATGESCLLLRKGGDLGTAERISGGASRVLDLPYPLPSKRGGAPQRIRRTDRGGARCSPRRRPHPDPALRRCRGRAASRASSRAGTFGRVAPARSGNRSLALPLSRPPGAPCARAAGAPNTGSVCDTEHPGLRRLHLMGGAGRGSFHERRPSRTPG